MPSSYTSNLGIEKPADGELDGVWGDVVNDNMEILDRAINGSVVLSLSGTSSTLTTTDGTLSDGQYKLLILGGSPSGTHTITIAPNDAQKIYFVRNTTSQSVIFTQGSGGDVTIAAGDSGIIYSDGGGSAAAVINITDDFAMSSVKITGGSINGTSVGATTQASGSFTTLTANSTFTADGSAFFNGSTILNARVGLGGTNYGVVGQVLTCTGTSLSDAPEWAYPFPPGGIIMWSGSIASIPSGWALCDGTNGTPNLRDRFVVGAGSTYAVGATGGADSVTLTTSQIPSHTHTFSGTTSTDGAHTHTITTKTRFSYDTTGGSNAYGQDTPDGTGPNLVTNSGGSHSHTFSGTTAATGGGTSHENRPPYYALAYIMKL